MGPRQTAASAVPESPLHSGTIALTNRSGYRTDDLLTFVRAGLRACGVTKPVEVAISASPIRTRGCAEVGGARLSLAVAPPSRFSRRRLARVLVHEAAHLQGIDHAAMDHDLLYSLGPTPAWAIGLPMRYEKRAPDQVKGLGGDTPAR